MEVECRGRWVPAVGGNCWLVHVHHTKLAGNQVQSKLVHHCIVLCFQESPLQRTVVPRCWGKLLAGWFLSIASDLLEIKYRASRFLLPLRVATAHAEDCSIIFSLSLSCGNMLPNLCVLTYRGVAELDQPVGLTLGCIAWADRVVYG